MAGTLDTSVDDDLPTESLSADTRGDMIARALAHSGYRELRDAECEISNRVVTLRGTVSSYFMKQVAQETVRRVDSNHLVRNLLHVEPRAGEQN